MTSTAPSVFTPAPVAKVRTDIAKNQCASGILAPAPADAWAGNWSGELIAHYCDSSAGHPDQEHGCGCGFRWDAAYRRLNDVEDNGPVWDQRSICGYCLGHAVRTDLGWFHLDDGQRVEPADHASEAHNRAGTPINPVDLIKVLQPVCGQRVSGCICGLNPNHNSPVHQCVRPDCRGTWTGTEPDFRAVRFPGFPGPDPVTMLVLVPGKPPEVHTMSPDPNTLRALVGGWLEAIELDHGAHMYVNEEPAAGLPANAGASLLVSQQRPGLLRARALLGTAVVLGSTTDGEEAACPEDILSLYRATPRASRNGH